LIYLDSSVALAQLLAEQRRPPEALASEELVSSRLLSYEIWTRIHALGHARSHGEEVEALLARVELIELSPEVLGRALEPFPRPVRTLDALHLASADFLRSRGAEIEIATYDLRMAEAATAIGLPLYAA
jgi:hypothetical protein